MSKRRKSFVYTAPVAKGSQTGLLGPSAFVFIPPSSLMGWRMGIKGYADGRDARQRLWPTIGVRVISRRRKKERTGTRKETYARMETVMNNAEKKDKKISSTRARRFYLDFVECGLGFIC